MKKKKILVILSIFIFIILSIIIFQNKKIKLVWAGIDNNPLNGKELKNITNVENDIYVQHNSEKNNINLTESQDMEATVYETINISGSGSTTLPSSGGYAIIISSNASDTENFAAQQLAKYLNQIDGKTYPILTDSDSFTGYSFYVGNTSKYNTSDISNKDDGSYNIVPLNNGLAIYGAGNRGTIYGVYGYLEDFCGYRCFTKEGMKSLTNEITIPTEIVTYDTFFEFTDTDWDSPRDTEYSIANGLNADTHRTIPDEMGGDIEYISSFCHTLGSDFCEANTYFNSHPEYYALCNGQRQPTQLCLTNENVYNIVLDEVIDLLEEYHDPDASLQIISLTQLDNADYCQCENCTAINNANGSPSGTMIDFVNKIAREVKNRGYNNVGIDTFAYTYTRKPPTQVIPENNVIVRLCSIECCFSHPLEDDSCEENAQFMDDLKEWNRICNRLYIWDYATNYAYTMTFFPNFKVLQDNIQTYYENGVKGVFVEGNYYIDDCDTEFGELRAYMISRLLRDPYCDIDQVMEEFCTDYYGPGGTYIKQFVDAMCEDATKNHLSIYSQMGSTCSITESQAEVLDGYWTQAENMATTDSQRAHLRRSKLSWRVVKDALRLREFKGTLKETADERQQFYDDIMELGITTIGEFLGDFPTGTNRPYQYIPIEDWRYADGMRLVFFDTNGGEGEPDIELVSVYLHIPADAVPVRAGYTFNGWSLDKNSTEQGLMPDGWYDWPVTGDTTIYALWKSDGSHTTHTGGTATCSHKAKCTVCGEEYGELDSSNHEKSTTHTINQKEATCKQDGYTGDEVYDCCNAVKSAGTTIPKTGHNGGTATCAHKAICTVCGEEYGELDSSNHEKSTTHTINQREATCKQDGYTGDEVYDCCNAVKSAGTTIPKTGHNGGTATCNHKAKCTVCGEEYGELNPSNHEKSTTHTINQREATCKQDGYTGDEVFDCCNAVKSAGTTIPKTGHTGGTATCSHKAKCTVCGEEYGELNPSNHEKSTTHTINQREATCKQDGYTGDEVYDCCNAVIKAGIATPKTNHKYDAGKVTKEPKVDEDGIRTYTCLICNEVRIETIPKLGSAANKDTSTTETDKTNTSVPENTTIDKDTADTTTDTSIIEDTTGTDTTDTSTIADTTTDKDTTDTTATTNQNTTDTGKTSEDTTKSDTNLPFTGTGKTIFIGAGVVSILTIVLTLGYPYLKRRSNNKYKRIK